MTRKNSVPRPPKARIGAPLKTLADEAKAQAKAKAAEIVSELADSVEDLAERLAPYPSQD